MTTLFSVSQITNYLRALLDSDEITSSVLVQGEISNFTHHSSGHMYFTLKDANSRLRSVMFRSRAASLQFKPQVGMNVIAQGNISVYERDGQYQLYVNSLRPAGQGELYLAFLKLKDKLEAEGLFDSARKRPLPLLPHTVGLVTSVAGAALHDILTVTKRRYPGVNILVAGANVQGAEAPASIVRGIELLGEVDEVDLIIVGRGGGSLEELMAFNDEQVARAIFNCPKPVIAAVGHETDFTIADFVADFRAATPSAAAEAAVPVAAELSMQVEAWKNRLLATLENSLLRKDQHLQTLSARLLHRHPERQLAEAAQGMANLEERLQRAMKQKLDYGAQRIQAAATNLDALSPLAVLARGYSISLKQNGDVIRQPAQVAVGEIMETVMKAGYIHSQVISVGGIKHDTN